MTTPAVPPPPDDAGDGPPDASRPGTPRPEAARRAWLQLPLPLAVVLGSHGIQAFPTDARYVVAAAFGRRSAFRHAGGRDAVCFVAACDTEALAAHALARTVDAWEREALQVALAHAGGASRADLPRPVGTALASHAGGAAGGVGGAEGAGDDPTDPYVVVAVTPIDLEAPAVDAPVFAPETLDWRRGGLAF